MRRTRFLSRIGARILAFNLLLVFLPIAAFLLLGTYERSLVSSLEAALVQQARLLAAWLGEAELDAARAGRALGAIGEARTARFRVVDAAGFLLADTARLTRVPEEIEPGIEGLRKAAPAAPFDPAAPAAPADPAARPEGAAEGAPEAAEPLRASADPEGSAVYRLLSAPIRLYRRYLAPPAPPLESADVYGRAERLSGPEVQAALAGRYGAATRISSGGQTSVTLYSALPIRREGRVIGAVLVSQSTYRILRELYALRLDAGRVFLWSAAAAGLLSLVLSLGIVRPIERLRKAALAALEARGGAAVHFPELGRRDEIGELGSALKGLAGRLDERLAASERFAADVAHEFKNPLASIRSSAELLEEAGAEAERRRFSRAIGAEVERLRALVDGLRRLARADSGGGERRIQAFGPAFAASWERSKSSAAARGAGLGRQGPGGSSSPRAETSFGLESRLAAGEGPWMEASRLETLLDNLLSNAASFAGSRVLVRLSREGARFKAEVEDDGPGIPEAHLRKIFDRFFSFRPGEERGGHTGLGLALARALAEAEGGSLEAENRETGGARFILRLPADRPENTSPRP